MVVNGNTAESRQLARWSTVTCVPNVGFVNLSTIKLRHDESRFNLETMIYPHSSLDALCRRTLTSRACIIERFSGLTPGVMPMRLSLAVQTDSGSDAFLRRHFPVVGDIALSRGCWGLAIVPSTSQSAILKMS
ncbi:hypothetical protein TNCV_222081 [Trichonephila clavipes]|nr:hypothetical protein TNCV_222081 [Trichonephila clavipes]